MGFFSNLFGGNDGDSSKEDGDDDTTPTVTVNPSPSLPEEVEESKAATNSGVLVDPIPPGFGVPAPVDDSDGAKYLRLRGEHNLFVSHHDNFCNQVLRLLPGEIHDMVRGGKSVPEAVEAFLKSRS